MLTKIPDQNNATFVLHPSKRFVECEILILRWFECITIRQLDMKETKFSFGVIQVESYR